MSSKLAAWRIVFSLTEVAPYFTVEFLSPRTNTLGTSTATQKWLVTSRR